MLSIIGITMIVIFLFIVLKNKLSIFNALSLVSLIFGVLVVIITPSTFRDLFDWIYSGVFFSYDSELGRISSGVIPASMLIMFAVFYFNTMLDAGLFDPAIAFFIKFAQGDPLRIMLATLLTSTVTSLSGDTTTTIIICLSTFLALYKQMKINLGYLSLMIIGPSIIFNLLPWGGPAVSAALVTEVSLNNLFMQMLPGMVVGYIYIFCVAVHLGLKERKRVCTLYADGKITVTNHQMDKMLESVYSRNKEYKRYNKQWFNLALTAVVLALLFADVAHGSILFLLGTAIALTVNYGTPEETMEVINRNAADAVMPALGSLAAGVFSGVLTQSGMAESLANDFTNIIPDAFSLRVLPFYAIMTGLFLIVLPTDAYFFGITRVLNKTFTSFGIAPINTAVASLIGESWAIMSPTIASIHVLTKLTEQSMGEYHKLYFKYYGVLMVIWLVVYRLTGAIVF